MALDEHALNYTSLLGIARALREQIDWHDLRTRTEHSPYAAAFFTLTERLAITPGPTQTTAAPISPRVRVVNGRHADT
jgi:hypothetical protein